MIDAQILGREQFGNIFSNNYNLIGIEGMVMHENDILLHLRAYGDR